MDEESSDERIQTYLREHLVRELRYPALNDVLFEVSDGNVTLWGNVPHRVMRQQIEEIALACAGVKHVQNNLNVALTASWPASAVLTSETGKEV